MQLKQKQWALLSPKLVVRGPARFYAWQILKSPLASLGKRLA